MCGNLPFVYALLHRKQQKIKDFQHVAAALLALRANVVLRYSVIRIFQQMNHGATALRYLRLIFFHNKTLYMYSMKRRNAPVYTQQKKKLSSLLCHLVR